MTDFDRDDRAVLAALADVLIPAGAGMPSASQAGVATQGLDRVLEARPELAQPLKALLGAARGRDPRTAIENLRSKDPSGFELLAELVPGAYFLDQEVRRALGYDGQSPRPLDPRPDYMEDGLLESVIRRGRIYRPTPDRAAD